MPPNQLPELTGKVRCSEEEWASIEAFVFSQIWYHSDPVCEEDVGDPVTQHRLPYGDFMLGFDFHLTDDGARLIEINTNAGGLYAALRSAAADSGANDILEEGLDRFATCVEEELRKASGWNSPQSTDNKQVGSSDTGLIVITDDDAQNQGLYYEMAAMAEHMNSRGISSVVCSPEELQLNDDKSLTYTDGRKVSLVYSRLVDFRLREARHQHLRSALEAGTVAITPHPQAYTRIADKRNLLRLSNPTVPTTMSLGDKTIEEWEKLRKDFVFKPPSGHASKGVYLGKKISKAKLSTLPKDTLAQLYCSPRIHEDGSKFDVRVFVCGSAILSVAARHFCGQVMEMQSNKSGFRSIFPLNFDNAADFHRYLWRKSINRENVVGDISK